MFAALAVPLMYHFGGVTPDNWHRVTLEEAHAMLMFVRGDG